MSAFDADKALKTARESVLGHGLDLREEKFPLLIENIDLRDEIRKLSKERGRLRDSIENIMYAIRFAMSQDNPIYFWDEWNQGEYETIKKEWPEFDGYLGEVE